MSSHTTPPHHLWASPGVRPGDPQEPLVIGFDQSALDFVVKLPPKLGDSISQFELPQLCTARPHEDPHVEAWLERWVDGIGPSEGQDSLEITGRSLLGLISLAGERPEVCPMFVGQLERFESILASWLKKWPLAEPSREGLVRTSEGALDGAPAPEDLELELYVALDLLRAGVPRRDDVGVHFRQVAHGWIFKLESLYSLSLSSQPERVATAAAAAINSGGSSLAWQLSLLSWHITEVEELLRCPFFRPQEQSLCRFAQRWWLEGAGGPSNGVDTDASLSDAILWELLPEGATLSTIVGASMAGPTSDALAPADAADAADVSEALVVEGAPVESREEETSGFISGSSFVHIPRFPDALLSKYDDPTSLHLLNLPHSAGVRCWNVASESEVVGAARQMIASRMPMSSAGGLYRMDLRVVSGADAETAHLFEVGLASEPSIGVQFKVSGPGASRPQSEGEATPFFGLVSVLDSLLEGVRMAVEIDFDERVATVRNLPATESADLPSQATPLARWLEVRSCHQATNNRPPGEQDDPLFREHAEHLHELIAEGMMQEELANTVLSDGGLRCIRGAGVADLHEDYYFYIVVPAGMEVEIY